MTFPNFVIAGAPKCGTTSLFDWMVAHPDVCGSRSKEPFFLLDREHPLLRDYLNIHDHGLDAYAKAFPRECERSRIVAEGSTQYIYQSTALDVLPALPSRPKVLFVVRKPSERIFSMFAFYKMKGHIRQDLGFAEFVERISGRADPNSDPAWTSPSSRYLLPREIGYSRYIDYLSKWRERLDDEHIRVLLFETMRADPKATVKGLCRWLGIDPAFYDDFGFKAQNPTSTLRSPAIQKLASRLAAPIRSGPLKELMKRLYYAVQATGRSETRSAADEAALAELDEYFRPFNARLAAEFGLDLRGWEQGR